MLDISSTVLKNVIITGMFSLLTRGTKNILKFHISVRFLDPQELALWKVPGIFDTDLRRGCTKQELAGKEKIIVNFLIFQNIVLLYF